MSSTPLLPQSFWFRLAVPCPRVDAVPRTGGKRLLALPDACRLPQTALLDGKTPWAEVRVGWNPNGLAVEVEAEGKLDAFSNDDRPEANHGVQLWVDTRDTRNVSRATRFCHRFDAKLLRGSGKEGLRVAVQQRPIARAVADAPIGKSQSIESRVERLKNRWRLELFFPSESLHGFDPETNRRLGFAYQVSDPDRGGEFLGVGREFPVGENPSLWSTLELREPD
jgi:hypothetical protein